MSDKSDAAIMHLQERLAQAQAEINLLRESADSMKAAWNTACAEIAALRSQLAEARSKAIIEYIVERENIQKAWRDYGGTETYGDFAVNWLAANKGE